MTKPVLVTGAAGFIGMNLAVALERRQDREVLKLDVGNTPGDLERMAAEAGVVYHLAGVNRPQDPEEFESGNVVLTRRLCGALARGGNKATLVVSSSTQAALDNPYGRSKRAAEEIAVSYAAETGADAYVFRLPNVFGKWCRPNYNSVVATFCHNLTRGLPITISDPLREIDLVHVDDVIRAFVALLDGRQESTVGTYRHVEPTYQISLEGLARLLKSFSRARSELVLPDMGDGLTRALYSTYVSYLPMDGLAYSLTRREDDRGTLAEVLKSPNFGQLFFSTTRPGVTRGNHYHDSKVEKFIVLSGAALIRFEHIVTGEKVDLKVRGDDVRVVDIPPGYTHSITNVGESELVVLFWANELFDPATPDAYYREVGSA